MVGKIIREIEQDYISGRNIEIPKFCAGDSVRVHVLVKEGERERVQIFEGVCIARHNNSIGSSFTVRKISYGEGVERVFPLYSPIIKRLEVLKRGDVRRAKLYYLRSLRGKKARITEKAEWRSKSSNEEESSKEAE